MTGKTVNVKMKQRKKEKQMNVVSIIICKNRKILFIVWYGSRIICLNYKRV